MFPSQSGPAHTTALWKCSGSALAGTVAGTAACHMRVCAPPPRRAFQRVRLDRWHPHTAARQRLLPEHRPPPRAPPARSPRSLAHLRRAPRQAGCSGAAAREARHACCLQARRRSVPGLWAGRRVLPAIRRVGRLAGGRRTRWVRHAGDPSDPAQRVIMVPQMHRQAVERLSEPAGRWRGGGPDAVQAWSGRSAQGQRQKERWQGLAPRLHHLYVCEHCRQQGDRERSDEPRAVHGMHRDEPPLA